MEFPLGDRFSTHNRYITEDVPVGCRVFYELSKLTDIKLPLIESLINISGIVVGKDYFKEGFDLDFLGFKDLGKEEILNYLRGGNSEK
jgi:opine dehydrogenase